MLNLQNFQSYFLQGQQDKFQTRKRFKLRNGKTSICVQPFNYYTTPNFEILGVELTDIQVK